jgi:hypothetical protein
VVAEEGEGGDVEGDTGLHLLYFADGFAVEGGLGYDALQFGELPVIGALDCSENSVDLLCDACRVFV